MPFSPRSPGNNVPDKVYLFNCPFEEKEDAKKVGAQWDSKAGSWYVPGGQNLEPFNRWHPNERKYLVCSYDEKDDAKKAGARWDASCKQWYFDADNSKAETKLAKWLPSKKASKSKTKKKLTDNTNKKATTTATKAKPKALTKSQIATIPRINSDLTIAQLHTECRARDPSIKGLSSKNKSWLLEHLKIGTPWISAEASTIEEPKKSENSPPVKKPAAAKKKPKAPTIQADMTVAQLQMECRVRDPDIKGLTNKNKSWFLDHLKIGTKWRSSSEWNDGKAGAAATSKLKSDPKTKTTGSTTTKKRTVPNATSKSKSEPIKKAKASTAIKKVKADAKSDSSKDVQQGARKIKKEAQSKIQIPKPLNVSSNSVPSSKKRAIKKDPDAYLASETQPSKKIQKISADSKPKAFATIKTCANSSRTKTATVSRSTIPFTSTRPLSDFRKVTSKMTLAKLQEEAKARQMDLTNLPKLKSDLLDRLVEGSICVHETREYAVYLGILDRVESNKSALLEAQEEKRRAEKDEIRMVPEETPSNFERMRGESLLKRFQEQKKEREKQIVEQLKEEEERIEQQRKEEEIRNNPWCAKLRFPPNIMKVEGAHLDPKSSGFNFTVWCSDVYHKQRYYSSELPEKEFDSVWKTKKEANSRAEYLFRWHNSFGFEPEELEYKGVIKEKNLAGGLKEWEAELDGGSQWLVGVVPSSAYLYLPNASTERHNYD